MSDEADIAHEFEESHRVANLRKALMQKFDTGISGECENCGEEMPRLVRGVCAPCRDGRRK